MRSLPALTSLLVLLGSIATTHEPEVRQVTRQYRERWLRGDADGVMSLLTPDSVLIPGEKDPKVGAAAIRQYWWPGGPPTVVTRFDATEDEIVVDANTATVRGTQVIEWKSGADRFRTHGNYLMVLRKTAGGWRIAAQMAANAPPQRL